jgi:hypothetical protein
MSNVELNNVMYTHAVPIDPVYVHATHACAATSLQNKQLKEVPRR